MQIYEEQNPFQSFQGGGGFNPVQEPDVAGAMERELRGGERRDRLYYDSLSRNDEQRVRNAQVDAEKISADIDANLETLSKFSETITGILDKKNVQKMKDKMAAASMLAYDDELYANGETTKFEKEEATVQKGQSILEGATAEYEASGGSPIAGERLRSLSGNDRIAYERTRLSLLSAEYPNYIQRNSSYLNELGISAEERDARRRQVAQQYLIDTGAVGVSPGMLNKYLLRRMREVDSKATNAWVAATEKDILLGRQQSAENDALIGAESGNIGQSAQAYIDARAPYVGRAAASAEYFTLLQNNEKLLDRQAIKDLASTPYTHPGFNGGKPSTFGKVFRGQIAKLEDAVADNQSRQVINDKAELEAGRAEGIAKFELEAAQLQAQGGRYTREQINKIMTDWEKDGLGEVPTEIKDYVTAEDFSINSGKEKLKSIYEKEGFITRDDLNGLNPALANDPEEQKMIADGSILQGRTEQQKDDEEARIKGLATDISGVSATAVNKGDSYGRALMEVRKDVKAAYMSNLRSGKYTSPDGTVDYDGALNDAVDKVKQGVYDAQKNPNGKNYAVESTAAQRATRGNREYIERTQLTRDGIKNNPKYIQETNFSTPEELEQAQKVLTTGTGDYPGIYKDLADGMTNTTPYDIAMAQLNAAGIKIEPQQTEEIVKAQEASTQRLLNYKNNLNRTERAFTPNNNAPGTVDPLAAVYVTGNIGPTSTGQHLDVKRTDGSYFEYKDLDNYVLVDDKDLGSRIPLSRVPETGDWQSHTVRGSHGRDYGTYSGSNIYLVNGARVVDSVSTVHGDRLQIELPDGKRFFFLHGTSRKVQTVPKPQPQTTSPQLNKRLTPQEIGNTLQSAGWPSHVIPTMMAVGMAESGGRAGVDTRQSGLDPNMRNEYSIGIFQINYKVHKQLVSSMGYTEQDLRDPTVNAKVALRIYQMQGLGAWGAYTNGSYRNFL